MAEWISHGDHGLNGFDFEEQTGRRHKHDIYFHLHDLR